MSSGAPVYVRVRVFAAGSAGGAACAACAAGMVDAVGATHDSIVIPRVAATAAPTSLLIRRGVIAIVSCPFSCCGRPCSLGSGAAKRTGHRSLLSG